MSTKALKPGSLILITGVNGYVGGHVAELLLSLGYRIRGTVRDQAKLEIVQKAFEKYQGQFEGVVVKDVSTEGAFSNIVTGTDGVVHVSSDVSFTPDPNLVITPVVKATENALKAAAHEASVKRFVYTSSVLAAVPMVLEDGHVISVKDWNDEDVEKAWAPAPYEAERAPTVYAASKVSAEKAAWEFVEKNKPGFVLNAVLPGLCMGPTAFAGQNLSTSGWVQALHAGDVQGAQPLLHLLPTSVVDIRDVARLHVVALLDTDVVNQRILASGEASSYRKVVDTLKAIDPSRQDYPAAPNNVERDIVSDIARSVDLLKREGRQGFNSLEQILTDQIAVS